MVASRDGSEASSEEWLDSNREGANLRALMTRPTRDDSSLSRTLKFYCSPLDARYEDLVELGSPKFYKGIFRDTMAGLVVAMIAIPNAMGFAIASGLQPAQGIIGGVVAGLMGALFGGSKFQMYGPSAGIIPVMASVMALNKGPVFDGVGENKTMVWEGGPLFDKEADLDDEEIFRRGHGLLVLVSLIAAFMLFALAMARAGSVVSRVPRCIVVGFTIGIAVTIGFALAESALGIESSGAYYGFWPKLVHIYEHLDTMNVYALTIAMGTLIFTKGSSYVSVFIPGALIAIVASTILAQTVWSEKKLDNIFDHYGDIPTNVTLTPPLFSPAGHGAWDMFDACRKIIYHSVQIAFVVAVESLLCARMADSMSDNQGTLFHPNKELWGQGLINAVTPLFNSFPHAGALSGTALNVQVGAVTPLAGILKCLFVLAIAFAEMRWLELMPMASIAGLLLYVALSMVSPLEISRVRAEGGWPHLCIMVLTAVLVVATDFLIGVASGMLIYSIGFILIPYMPEWMLTSAEDGTKEEKEPILKGSDP